MRKLRFPKLSEDHYRQTLQKARLMGIDLNQCPTCGQRRHEEAPGVWIWRASTYRLYGQQYDCDCEMQCELRWQYLAANIPSEYWTLSDEDFIGDQHAISAIKEYLDLYGEFRKQGIGLTLYSKHQGVGKTMLACLAAKHLLKRNVRTYFMSFQDAIAMPSNMPYEKREQKLSLLRNIPFVVLDEVGRGFTDTQQDYYAQILEEVIRHRTNYNLITIMTTNLTGDEMNNLYSRVYSLLVGKQKLIEVSGQDFRGKMDLKQLELVANHETRPLV